LSNKIKDFLKPNRASFSIIKSLVNGGLQIRNKEIDCKQASDRISFPKLKEFPGKPGPI
jgi:hypothetical protein